MDAGGSAAPDHDGHGAFLRDAALRAALQPGPWSQRFRMLLRAMYAGYATGKGTLGSLRDYRTTHWPSSELCNGYQRVGEGFSECGGKHGQAVGFRSGRESVRERLKLVPIAGWLHVLG